MRCNLSKFLFSSIPKVYMYMWISSYVYMWILILLSIMVKHANMCVQFQCSFTTLRKKLGFNKNMYTCFMIDTIMYCTRCCWCTHGHHLRWTCFKSLQDRPYSHRKHFISFYISNYKLKYPKTLTYPTFSWFLCLTWDIKIFSIFLALNIHQTQTISNSRPKFYIT